MKSHDEGHALQLEEDEQMAFWGPDIIQKLERSETELSQRPPRYLSEEAFFTTLARWSKKQQGEEDADI